MSTITHDRTFLDTLNAMDAEELLHWAGEHHGAQAGIVTSFQNTGCVMIDMASRAAPDLRVLTVDTWRLHEETYSFIEEIEERYRISVERYEPDPQAVHRMIQHHGEFLFFDSKAKQEYCCHIRKVEPNRRALATLDVWITGLRKDQSDARKETPKVSLIEQDGRPLLKLCPLAEWSEDDVWDYIRERNIPYNRLYDKGYTSIGCIICTTPTKPGEDKRAGRWRWFNALDQSNKECGIHTAGSGI